jgi:hypothetical protein
MDVLKELLLPQVFEGISSQPFKGGIYEGELPLHIVGDDPLPHGSGDSLELTLDFGRGALRPPPAPALSPEEDHQQDEESEQRASWQEVGAGEL